MVGTSNLGSWNGHWLNGEHDDQQDDQPWATMGFGDILVADTDVRAMSLEAVPREMGHWLWVIIYV